MTYWKPGRDNLFRNLLDATTDAIVGRQLRHELLYLASRTGVTGISKSREASERAIEEAKAGAGDKGIAVNQR